MPQTEQLEVLSITPRSVKNGTMTIYEILDGRTRRTGSTFDESWVKGMKIGDTVDVIWKRGEYKGKEQWSLDNPSKAKGSGGGFRKGGTGSGNGGAPLIVYAWQVAAQLAPYVWPKGGKKLEDIEKLALAVLEKFNKGLPPAPAKQEEAPAAKPAAPAPKPKAPEPVEEEGFDDPVVEESTDESEDSPF